MNEADFWSYSTIKASSFQYFIHSYSQKHYFSSFKDKVLAFEK